MRNQLDHTQMQQALAAVRDDDAAYALAFDEALTWLEKDVVKKITPAANQTEAARILDKYKASFFPAMRATGPPAFPTLENGCCDGSKALEGLFDNLHRKLGLLKEDRTKFGPLKKPKKVLLMGSAIRKGARKIVKKWVEVPR